MANENLWEGFAVKSFLVKTRKGKSALWQWHCGEFKPQASQKRHTGNWLVTGGGRFNTQQVSNRQLFLQKTNKKTPNNPPHLQARCPFWIRINIHTENVCSDWKSSQKFSLQTPGEGNLKLPPCPTHCPHYGAALTKPNPSTYTLTGDTNTTLQRLLQTRCFKIK